MADRQASHDEGSARQTATLADPARPEAARETTRPAPRPSLAEIIGEQERIFIDRQPESARLAAEAREALAGGVTSSWQISRPQPVWLSHGSGSKLYDVDGNEYVDMHGGYGVSLAGHAHPAIVAAVQHQVDPRYSFRPADPGRARGGQGTQPPVRAAAVAVRQLRHRGDDGRGAPDARDHRPGSDHQGRGLLSRAPRLGSGLGVPGPGRDRPGRPAGQRAGGRGRAARADRPDGHRRVQRPRHRAPGPRPSTRARSPG